MGTTQRGKPYSQHGFGYGSYHKKRTKGMKEKSLDTCLKGQPIPDDYSTLINDYEAKGGVELSKPTNSPDESGCI